MNKEPKIVLISGARDLGINLSRFQVDLLVIYLNELWEWNKQVNLTGLSSIERIINELLIDSLIPAPFLPESGWFLDAGSGAGFPAIPLKILRPRLDTHLVEPKSKKTAFLKHVIRLTGIQNIDVIRGRIEKGKNMMLHPGGYDVITARALSNLPNTLALCAPLLKPGGIIFNFQGTHFENALKQGAEVIKQCGLILHESIPYKLPGMDYQRHLLIFKKKIDKSRKEGA